MERAALELMAIGITGKAKKSVAFEGSYPELLKIAARQGVIPQVLKGLQVQKQAGYIRFGLEEASEWVGQIYFMEKRSRRDFVQFTEYAKGLQPHKCVVLKGFDYARNWPNFFYRSCGDMDCWSPSDIESVNAKAAAIGAEIDYKEGMKHTHTFYKDIMIEQHVYFINEDSNLAVRSNELMTSIIGGEFIPIADSALLSPNADFTALFMLHHALNHFILEGLALRHLLDWYYFLVKNETKVDWTKVNDAFDKMHIRNFANLMTGFCVKYLDYVPQDPRISYGVDERLLNKVLKDIVHLKTKDEKPGLFRAARRAIIRIWRIGRFRPLLEEPYFAKLKSIILYNTITGLKPKLDKQA